MRSDHADVAPELDQAMFDPVLAADLGRGIRGVLLHESAEVQLHPGPWQRDPRPFPSHLRPSHQRQQGLDLLHRRQPTRPKVPGAAKYARRDIEPTAALDMRLSRVVEQAGGFVVHPDALAGSGRGVDARREAVGLVARVALLQPIDRRARGGAPRVQDVLSLVYANGGLVWNLANLPLLTNEQIETRKIYNTEMYSQANTGHAFTSVLTDDERRALIEYLKTL
nr:hypothetical protein [Panacagrimonas sp.]